MDNVVNVKVTVPREGGSGLYQFEGPMTWTERTKLLHTLFPIFVEGEN